MGAFMKLIEAMYLRKKAAPAQDFFTLPRSSLTDDARGLTSSLRPDRKKVPTVLPVIAPIHGELFTTISTVDEDRTARA
jgi:hypothetical protein